MKKYFPFDSAYPTEQYLAIGKTIKHFYPTGVSSLDPEYHEYPGIIELKELIGNNMPDKNYRKRWVNLLDKIHKESGKQIELTTYGFPPSLSANLILEHVEHGSLTYIKRIAFAVSFLGPFYSICGVDETFIREDHDEFPRNYHAINCVTASPYKEFESDFNGIKHLIQKKFPGYQFVPFWISMMHLKDIETLTSIGQEGTVYNALFNHLFNFYTHHISRGDQYYGVEKNPKIKVTLSPPPKVT
jgi:hypothetical protein